MAKTRRKTKSRKSSSATNGTTTIESLAPETAKQEPQITYLYLPATQTGGVRVTPELALTIPTVWDCVKIISEDLAKIPFNVYRKMSNGGRERVADNPVDWLLSTQANPDVSAFQFRETMIAHALLRGNGYAEIERDGAGRPQWLWIIWPDAVTPSRYDNGELYYEVRNGYGLPNSEIPAANMLHLKGLGYDGLVGYSVISYAARSFGCAISSEQTASSLYANDSTPGGVLKHPGKLSDAARKNIRDGWQARHGGPSNRRTVAILEEGMEWQQTSLPPDDTQLLQSRQYSREDVAKWFRVPPHKIGDLTRATFSNIEQQSIEYVNDTLTSWAKRFEQECDLKLFGRTARGQYYTKHNFNALLRGDAESRAKFYQMMLDRGVFSINDVLELEDRNPIGPDGDKRFIPLNMQLLEKAGEEPPPGKVAPNAADPAASDEQPAADEQPADDSQPDPAQTHAPIFAEALGRCWQRARNEAKRTKSSLSEWFATYREGHSVYAVGALMPAAQSLAMLLGAYELGDVCQTVQEFIALHLERLLNALPDGEMDIAHEANQLACAIKLSLAKSETKK